MTDLSLNDQKTQIIWWYNQDEVSIEEIVQRLNHNGQEYTVEQVIVQLRQWNALAGPLSLNVELNTSNMSHQVTSNDLDISSSADQGSLTANLQMSLSIEGVTPQKLSSLPHSPTPFENYYEDDHRNDPFCWESAEQFPKEASTLIMESRWRQSGKISKFMEVVGLDDEGADDDVHADLEVSSGSAEFDDIQTTPNGPPAGSLETMSRPEVVTTIEPAVPGVADNDSIDDDSSSVYALLMSYRVRTAEQNAANENAARSSITPRMRQNPSGRRRVRRKQLVTGTGIETFHPIRHRSRGDQARSGRMRRSVQDDESR